MQTDKPDFSGSFTERWIKHVRLPLKTDKPNQWSFLERLERGRSLVLVVSHGGTKSWRALWYEAGKPKSAKLGTYPDMGVADARKAAGKFKPEQHTASKEAGTFTEVAADFIKRHVDKKGLRSKREIERQLNVYVYPKWKDRAFFDIKRRDVNKLLDDIEDDHGARQADAVLATIRKMFSWYESRDDQFVSPVVRGMKRGEYKPRERWLSDDEIRNVWAACDHEDLYRPYGAMIRLMLLTGQRREKLSTMQWEDVDDKGIWTIAHEAREKGTPPSLTLSQAARDIIATIPRMADNPYVFAGRGKKAFNAFSQRKAEIDKLLPTDMPHWIHHDLRRTARKLMTRRHVETEIAERALGHSIKGIQAVYDDPREYGPRVDQALEAVASEIALIVHGPDDDKIARIGAIHGA
ncbi:tyrosine-type recombinase/integrase [Mesorhizobium sp. B1-1-8]|uniref:tyrosine-type recombinase/integrase n=1 Tax=Mesorhizobium sp. B1-1-8 TaxID=2589976 RepID=UPI0015E46283|nr:integrase family protein [Mesorhizobium sp. B1-1-8]UCI09986.1 integrase family protein [Mesorhizobium sp. B1-1-8]